MRVLDYASGAHMRFVRDRVPLAMDKRSPSSTEEISELIQDAARAGSTVQVSGGGTKLGWGPPVEADFELSLSGMDEVLEHNEGDLTAVLQAGVPLHRAQAKFAERRRCWRWTRRWGSAARRPLGA